MSSVAVVKGERSHVVVHEALDLIDYKTVLEGYERVLIKVNFITVKRWDTGATTDPLVVEAIIQKLKELPVEILVVESDATFTNANKAFKVTGMAEMCERNGVEWVNLRHVKERVVLPVRDGEALKSIKVPRMVVESAVISAAKMKTHSETKVTLGMKNMFGLLPDKFKSKFHAKGISRVIVDINTAIKPALTVIDGFVAMEGRGPAHGKPVKMGLVISGTDPVATDATATRIMGFNPFQISHIRRAYEKGLGKIDDILVVGETVENVSRAFKRPSIF